MAKQIRLQPYQIDDFQAIYKLGSESLKKAVERLKEIDPVPMSPDELSRHVAEVLDGKSDVAESIVRQCLMIFGWIRQGRIPLGEVHEILGRSLKSELEWNGYEIQEWEKCKPAIEELLSLPILRLAARATELSYEYANLWRGARILTDIRPIYNDDATAVDGAVVSLTFRLRYESIDSAHELSIALDESDVRELAKQCNRALQKAQIARELMKEKAKTPTMISGESDNA